MIHGYIELAQQIREATRGLSLPNDSVAVQSLIVIPGCYAM
jgi:hypothetical protein